MDDDLKRNVKIAKTGPVSFALALKGSTIAMAMSRRSITAKQKKELKEQTGGGVLYDGTVEGGEEGYTFTSTRTLPNSAAKTIQKYIRSETGISITAILA
jgi:hypothetical protein